MFSKFFKKETKTIPKIVEDYLETLGKNLNDFKGKSILDIGCGSGEFVQYLINHNITNQAYGLDVENDQGEDIYKLKIDPKHFFHQSYDEKIEGKYDLIIFKNSIYPNKVNNIDVLLSRLVKENLTEKGEIILTIDLNKNTPLGQAWTQNLKNVLINLRKNNIKIKINKSKTLMTLNKK